MSQEIKTKETPKPSSPKQVKGVRALLLEEVIEIISKDRTATHGEPEDTFPLIAEFWSSYLGIPLSPHDVCSLMELLKIARRKANPLHKDNWADGAGYAGCGWEQATR